MFAYYNSHKEETAIFIQKQYCVRNNSQDALKNQHNFLLAAGSLQPTLHSQTTNEFRARTEQASEMIHNTHALTFGEVLDMWLASKSLYLKESSYSRYLHLIGKHIKPSLGSLPVSELTRTIIESYICALLSSGRLDGHGGLAPKSASDILLIVKSAVDYAKGIVQEINCPLEKTKVRRHHHEMRVLTLAEQQELNRILFEDSCPAKLGILISLYAGLRLGEVCALQWKHIELIPGIIHVKQTMQRIQCANDGVRKTKIIITEPKSECSRRDIPVPDNLLHILCSYYLKEPDAYVLTGSSKKFMEPRTLQNKFKHYAEKSGIAPANYHSLRHSFATRCVELGCDIKSLSELLGHTNVNTTLNRYVHSSLDQKRISMEKLNIVMA